MRANSLGELEQKIMDILWKSKSSTSREILDMLEIDKKLAYTTIATILQRLYDKKLVTRIENTRGYIYSPKITKERYTKNVAQLFLKKFIGTFGDTAIASFADSIDKLPEKKREYFLKLLDNNDSNK